MRHFGQLMLVLPLLLVASLLDAQRNPRNVQQEWETDKSQHKVPLDEFKVIVPRDGIPPIDRPVFWEEKKARELLDEDEPVISLEMNGDAKAYPLSILMYHEIVNDKIGGKPVTVTYCPLCNSAIVFDRKLTFKGEEYMLDFGVSGMLRKSDLVMWDRQTQSWWQQFTGEAVVGALTGAQLDIVPSSIVSLHSFLEAHPQGKVLSTVTGAQRDYGTNPYKNYDQKNNSPRLFSGEIDSRLPPMERVVHIEGNDNYKAYPFSTIQEQGVINDTHEDQPVVIFHKEGTHSALDAKQISQSKDIGSVVAYKPTANGKRLRFTKEDGQFVDEQTGSKWTITGKCVGGELKSEELKDIVHGNHFAFSWFAFHPDSKLYEAD